VGRTPIDCADAIAAMMDVGMDLMWRYLADRDGLSASATLVLNRVSREGPMRLTALAEAEGVSQSGMTQLVQRMERQGLVERWSDPDDGRVSLVKIGDGGRRIWKARSDLRRQRLMELLPELSHDDQISLWLAAAVAARVLGQIRDAACARNQDMGHEGISCAPKTADDCSHDAE
jgi:DNA-binding MarR family transcriptional regulator